MYCIYRILLKNRIVYIGRTNNPEVRWYNHKYHETNDMLRNYFLANDIEHFTFEVIYDNLTYHQAKELETQLIEEEQKTNFYLANSDIGDKKSFHVKDKIANTCRNYWYSPEAASLREKLANASKNRKQVYDPKTNQLFESITDAAKVLNISRNAIYYRLQKNLMYYIE